MPFIMLNSITNILIMCLSPCLPVSRCIHSGIRESKISKTGERDTGTDLYTPHRAGPSLLGAYLLLPNILVLTHLTLSDGPFDFDMI